MDHPKKIALVGAWPETRLQAPFSDPAWEVWGCSSLNLDLPPTAIWFEVNKPHELLAEGRDLIGYTKFLAGHPKVFLNHPWYALNRWLPYPQELKTEIGAGYFDSALAYMLAFAFSCRSPEEIGIWGVGMHPGTVCGPQRPALLSLMRMAEQRGIRVTAPGSDLFTHQLPGVAHAPDQLHHRCA